MPHPKLDVMQEKGFVVLRDYDGPAIPDGEFLGLEYMDWKSGGDTNFAPIASALGEMECAGFWDHGKPDKDGIWTSNAAKCPTLVDYVERAGARYGRVRSLKLNPSDGASEAAALRRACSAWSRRSPWRLPGSAVMASEATTSPRSLRSGTARLRRPSPVAVSPSAKPWSRTFSSVWRSLSTSSTRA